MIDIFDMLGPIMVGPSSSHTAGAVRIGLMARTLLGERPVEAKLLLHGSFASTGVGHGTDRALVAGLLGMQPDDMEIPNSFALAEERGMHVTFDEITLKNAHPNSVLLNLLGEDGSTLNMQACSIGGGRIQVTKLDGVDVDRETLASLLSVDRDLWREEAKQIRAFYAQFGDKLPHVLAQELENLEARLKD